MEKVERIIDGWKKVERNLAEVECECGNCPNTMTLEFDETQMITLDSNGQKISFILPDNFMLVEKVEE